MNRKTFPRSLTLREVAKNLAPMGNVDKLLPPSSVEAPSAPLPPDGDHLAVLAQFLDARRPR